MGQDSVEMIPTGLPHLGGDYNQPLCVLSHSYDLAPLSMGFSRQAYWSGLSCPPPGNLSDPGIEPMSPVAPAL